MTLLPDAATEPGSTLAVSGATSALFAVAAALWPTGGWGALAGLPDAGLLAAAEAGLPLERCVLVPDLGRTPARALSILVDGFDIVLAAPARLAPAERRTLDARVRRRDTRLLIAGPWPTARAELKVSGQTWSGLGVGRGLLAETRYEAICLTEKSGLTRPSERRAG